MWDYQGGFGLFNENSNEFFDNDLNVPLLEALELNVPAQTEYTKKPRTQGFVFYDDYVGEGIVQTPLFGPGTLDYYNSSKPHDGRYSLYWTGVNQYSNIGFVFTREADLSLLKDKDSIKFWVRGNTPGAKFDIRFVDTKSGATDRPWRMGKTIDDTFAAWDGAWHHVQLSLKSLEEKGAYDNDIYYNAEGKFDWSSIDRLEIVAEHSALNNIAFSFDNIEVSGKGDAVITGTEPSVGPVFDLRVYPNPTAGLTTVHYQVPKSNDVNIAMYNAQGQKIKVLANEWKTAGRHSITFNASDQHITDGLYLLRIESQGLSSVIRLWVRPN